MDTQNTQSEGLSESEMSLSGVEQESKQENRKETSFLVPTEQEKSHAHRAVAKAIRNGELICPEHCEHCGKVRILHAHHHEGYGEDSLLKVQWLCRSCHRRSHESILTPELRVEHRNIRRGRQPFSKPQIVKTVNVRDVDESMYERLRLEAFQRRCSMGQVLNEALKDRYEKK